MKTTLAVMVLAAAILLCACGGGDPASEARATVQTLIDAIAAQDISKANAQILPSELAGNELGPSFGDASKGKLSMATSMVVPQGDAVTVYVKITMTLGDKVNSHYTPYVCAKENGRWYISPNRTKAALGQPMPAGLK
ncbi:MAG: hypothetical protein IT462_11330 [Planctomycetes bacterium]|nr:hypothetical protein [Planctomycetota bacterium]